ncbi:MAG: hypothetical protein JSW02_08015, partial [candidate division WOR-3 bacterium]
MNNHSKENQPSAKLASPREKISGFEQKEQGRRPIEDELKEIADDLNLINNLNQAFNQGASLPELLDLLAHETKRLYESKGATIYVLSPDKKNLILYKHKTVFNGLKKL